MNRLKTLPLLLAIALLSACKREPDSPQQPAGGTAAAKPSVASLVEGYWLPSAESLFEIEKANLEANPPEGGIDPNFLAELREHLEQSVEAFIFHLEGGKSRALSQDRVETGTYTLAAVDDAAGTFEATLSEDGGQTVTGPGSVSQETLTLSTIPNMPAVKFNRSTKAEWDRRMAALNGTNN